MKLDRMLMIVLAVVCTRDAVSQAVSPAQGKQPAISVVLRAEHDTVKARDPIILKETLTNRSDHEVTFGRDVDHPGCAVDVLDESGKFPPDKRLGYRHGRLDLEQAARTLPPEQLVKSGLVTGSIAWISLKPGEAFVETCDVNAFYDMVKPGVYKIAAQFHDPDTATTVKSNTITITVTKPE
jgi:hypothetical protein